MKTRYAVLLVCGFLCLIIKPASSQRTTEFGIAGESKKLICPFTQKSNLSRWWWGPPGVVFFFANEKNYNAQRSDRLFLVQNITSNAYDLRITNLTKGIDNGTYKCQVDRSDPLQEYLINLEFFTPLVSVTLSPMLNNTVIAGQLMNLTCTTSYCNPPANITWYISSNDISSQSMSEKETQSDLVKTISHLQRKVMEADNGENVSCIARNIFNQSVQSLKLKLNVLYKPHVTSITRSPHKVLEGQEAALKCNVTDANPNSIIEWTWYRNDRINNTLSNGQTYTISEIQKGNSGAYTCLARNLAGTSDPISITVDVQYKPDVMSNASLYTVRENQTVTLGCLLIDANPDNDIIWRWINTKNPSLDLSTQPSYSIFQIQRKESGTYNCTAHNSAGTSEAASIKVDVQYPPIVNTLDNRDIKEDGNLSVTCLATPGNPESTTFVWTKKGNKNFIREGDTLKLPNIHRNDSGIYICKAENMYANEMKGTASQVMTVNVIYKPEILNKGGTIVNESETVTLTREIASNPLSNVSWYDGSQLLQTQLLVENTTYIIEKAKCTDTKNFTLVASNIVERNVTGLVELIVNCKPQSYDANITLGITDLTGIEFSVTIIAYPEPQYELQYENGTKNIQMMDRITKNSLNNFTIHYNQTVVRKSDYGFYHLILSNEYGKSTVYVNIIPQRKPNMPKIFEPVCEIKRARIQWTSSFNGGEPQIFTVITLNAQSKSSTTPDKGENEIHSAYVQNLKPSTTYVFYVSAQNSHGITSSENVSCTTSEEEGVNLPLIAGGAVAGGITLAIIVIAIVLMFRRYTKNEKQAGKPQRLKDELCENRDTDDDGLKENILYVSADTRDIDKPESAVYAAVNKKSQESNNNANVYAEVNKSEPKIREGALYSDVKPKKGFLKKKEQDKVGDKPKQRKGKKQKTKQEIADVYENSEDIAMTPNVDNVYSNSEHKNQSETKQRGYKNKDGLLYVEVNFDGKQGQDNPVIHGEDEKTDYATVEFPMPSALHKASGSEEL